MRNLQHITLLGLFAALLLAPASCGPETSAGQEQEARSDGTEDHAQSDQHADHDEGEEEIEAVTLTEAQLREYGVELAPLTGGPVATHLSLPAEVGLNQDALVHVTPRVPGVVAEVNAYLGDVVVAGQSLAVLESPELGEAKITLLQALQAKTLADADLDRQRTISANTKLLLELLRTEPTLEALQAQSSAMRIGKDKGRLISAYARLIAGRANFARERELREKGLSTQADLIVAQESYNSALAEYMAVFEEIDFTFGVRLQDAQRAAQVATSAVENAGRRLHILGISDEKMDVVHQESHEDISRYVITAPIAGRIVSKHISPGEKVDGESSIFTIADLSTVWLNIAVYERYLDQINEGHEVVVHAGDRKTNGRVVYVSTAMTEGTRTLTARVVLDNADGRWRPGEFTTVRIETNSTNVERRVPIVAVQQWEGRNVIFVQTVDGIVPVPVTLGLQNDKNVEIFNDDLPIGSAVVVRNSFLMKSELGKNSAGHGH